MRATHRRKHQASLDTTLRHRFDWRPVGHRHRLDWRCVHACFRSLKLLTLQCNTEATLSRNRNGLRSINFEFRPRETIQPTHLVHKQKQNRNRGNRSKNTNTHSTPTITLTLISPSTTSSSETFHSNNREGVQSKRVHDPSWPFPFLPRPLCFHSLSLLLWSSSSYHPLLRPCLVYSPSANYWERSPRAWSCIIWLNRLPL